MQIFECFTLAWREGTHLCLPILSYCSYLEAAELNLFGEFSAYHSGEAEDSVFFLGYDAASTGNRFLTFEATYCRHLR